MENRISRQWASHEQKPEAENESGDGGRGARSDKEAGEVEAAHERAQEARLDMTLMLFLESH